MKLKLFVTLTTVTLAVAASHVARAQAPSGTLAKIRDAGEIRLGHRDVSIPFSYLDDQQKPIGFAMDLVRQGGGRGQGGIEAAIGAGQTSTYSTQQPDSIDAERHDRHRVRARHQHPRTTEGRRLQRHDLRIEHSRSRAQ